MPYKSFKRPVSTHIDLNIRHDRITLLSEGSPDVDRSEKAETQKEMLLRGYKWGFDRKPCRLKERGSK